VKSWFRLSEWWNSKIAVLTGFIYLFYIGTDFSIQQPVYPILFLFIWMFFSAALGYYINDVFDLEKDTLSNKKNFTANHSLLLKSGICILLIAINLLNWFVLSKDIAALGLMASQIILFLLYSLPFPRLKERPVIAIITDSLYAHVIPGLMVFYTIKHPDTISFFALVFVAWLFLSGVRNIINHHIDDFANDTLSGTRTSAVAAGKIKMKRIMNYLISPLEIIAFLTLLILLWAQLPFICIAYPLYMAWVFNRELIFVKANKHIWTREEQESYNFMGGVVLNEFYEKWFPLICLLFFIAGNLALWPLLIVHTVLFFYNIRQFYKDYLIVKNLILVKVYWITKVYSKEIIKFVYYKIYARIKHFIYWNLYIPISGKR
jgi:4-hydroxybenzoate polyprenyltransferase